VASNALPHTIAFGHLDKNELRLSGLFDEVGRGGYPFGDQLRFNPGYNLYAEHFIDHVMKTTNYVVFHWRSETIPPSRAMMCSNILRDAIKKCMNQRVPVSPGSTETKWKYDAVYLVSDILLSINSTFISEETRNGYKNGTYLALQEVSFAYLRDSAFHGAFQSALENIMGAGSVKNNPERQFTVFKYESVPYIDFNDVGMMAVLEQKLSIAAEGFATCTNRKKCKICARISSHYGAVITNGRQALNLPSKVWWADVP
jgi:hypothetical protein